ncbi:MAG: hydantoinase/oxoprolinase family protein [Chloroflexi bacterium]|nr:hydantoinase/oxoprolinase family protein [Chloroflexota bacterium]
MRVGVDVGGTNTDAVVMDGDSLRAWAKTPTTSDVTSGIVGSVTEALARAELPVHQITGLMIGTTHFTNAVVQGRHLSPTAVVRLGLPATASVPPLADWPDQLRRVISGHGYLAHGGYEFDGRPIAPLDPNELRNIAADIQRHGARAVAVCAVFSPIRADLEQEAAAILREQLPHLTFSLSNDIGRLGLLERENACVLNACLSELAERTITAMQEALRELGVGAPLYLSQNDGTLMSAEFARRYPVLTFASGPTNSMRGAAYLSGLPDAIVIDVGGTTSDVGALSSGFPREAGVAVKVGGVRTNFRMPDLLSLGLGGGSLIHTDPLRVGPDSVGYRLTEQARVFGGDVFTATDAAVAAGALQLGDATTLAPAERALAPAVLELVRTRLADAIDQVKTSEAAVPVVLVGGGSILLRGELTGASEVVRPEHSSVANAIGAAIAQVSGEIDRVRTLDGLTRLEVVQEAHRDAADRAVAAGADPTTIQVVDSEDVPLAYLPGNATRVRVKVVGNLRDPYVARR